jgi:hypothetical protein
MDTVHKSISPIVRFFIGPKTDSRLIPKHRLRSSSRSLTQCSCFAETVSGNEACTEQGMEQNTRRDAIRKHLRRVITQPPFNCALMPTHMRARFSVEELRGIEDDRTPRQAYRGE